MSLIYSAYIARIIAGFSPLEREIFVGMGGVLPPVTAQPEPIEWRKPNTLEDGWREAQVKRESAAQRKRKERKKKRRKVPRPKLMAPGPVKRKQHRRKAA